MQLLTLTYKHTLKASSSIQLFFLTAILVWGYGVHPAHSGTGEPDFELFASRKGDMVQLYWECRAWPAGMAGFVLKRSESGASEWAPLHDGPIMPAIDQVESFRNRGLSEEMEASLRHDFMGWLQEGNVQEISVLTMREIFNESGGPGAGDRIAMKSDFRVALLSGFGFTDNTAQPGTSYDYALYAAYTDGTTSTQPLAMFRLGDPQPLDPEYTFSAGRVRITLDFEIPHTEIIMSSILGFLIERSNTDGSATHILASDPMGYSSITEGVCFYRIVDYDIDPSRDYLYTLTPVNMFQQRGDPIVLRYVAARYKPLSPPVIDEVSLVDDEHMDLTWRVAPEDSLLLSHFVLELLRSPGKEVPPVVVDTIVPSARQYTDTTPKGYGEMYFYRLRSLGMYGQEVGSDLKAFYYLGLSTPPPVTGLTGELMLEDEKPFVKLRWDPKVDGDTLTARFAIYTDILIPDSFLHVSHLPRFLDNTYKFPIPSHGGRTYQFRVAGMSRLGRAGTPAEVSVDVGTLYLPRVLQVSSKRLSPSGLLIQWEYPAFQDLIGFRLMMNDREIAGVDHIKGDMRSYVVEEELLAKEPNPSFQLTAVGSVAISDPGLRHTIHLPAHQIDLFPSPASLVFELLESSSGMAVQLCWEPPFGEEESVTGYALFADYNTPGRLQRINTVPVIRATEYIYTLPVAERDEVNLGIAAITKEGTTGQIARVSIPIKNNNKEIINNDKP